MGDTFMFWLSACASHLAVKSPFSSRYGAKELPGTKAAPPKADLDEEATMTDASSSEDEDDGEESDSSIDMGSNRRNGRRRSGPNARLARIRPNTRSPQVPERRVGSALRLALTRRRVVIRRKSEGHLGRADGCLSSLLAQIPLVSAQAHSDAILQYTVVHIVSVVSQS